MVNDADWVSEVRQWYLASQGQGANARAAEVIDAAGRAPQPLAKPRPRPPAPVRLALAPPSRFSDSS